MYIIEAIKKLKNSKRTFFTTPAHRCGGIIPNGLKTLIGYKAFSSDFSEVDGLDNLKHPESCILKSQQRASEIYNTKATFFLTQGSSSGIIAAIMSCVKDGEKILIARNAHESVFNALVLAGAIPVWFLPEHYEEFDVNKGVTLKQIEKEFKKNSDIKAVFITSPTYEGVVSEVEKIAEFCKSKKVVFIVDEAHGALFPFSEKLPDSAINLGADLVVHSLHKTAPALTGSALLHIGKNSEIDAQIIQKNLNLITTTSPSWLIIASIEGAIEFLCTKKCKKKIEELLKNIGSLKARHKDFKFLKNDDETKLFIAKDDICGSDLSAFLDESNIEDELITEKGVLCLCGIGTTKKKLKKLSHVLEKFSEPKNKKEIQKTDIILPEMAYKPKDVFFKETQIIKKEDALGRVIAENITPYPPCIPVLMSGEIICAQHLKYIGENVKVIK
ncbi:MAG: aminotransferase class I/II-fold pyridoxal phosphate-dependent enzyme [bacterium]|nr:aminotransferase class I/II-fold pyridoxal phosphate-dependent enzyme [bacterium]